MISVDKRRHRPTRAADRPHGRTRVRSGQARSARRRGAMTTRQDPSSARAGRTDRDDLLVADEEARLEEPATTAEIALHDTSMLLALTGPGNVHLKPLQKA